MFLNFQTREDICREILQTFAELNRAATIPEIAKAIWARSGVDGTRSGVHDTVCQTVLWMVKDGRLEVVGDCGPGTVTTYYRPDLLTRLSFIAP